MSVRMLFRIVFSSSQVLHVLLRLPLLYVHYLAHDDHQNFNFLFRLRQLRNNCSKFIEYLVPAL